MLDRRWLIPEYRDAVCDQITEAVTAIYSNQPGFYLSGCCLAMAVLGADLLKRSGVRAILQAGSCFWPRKPREEWGNPPRDHLFGYEWLPKEPITWLRLCQHVMPEVHIWIALPEIETIVDFSAGFGPEQAERLGVGQWTGPRPPMVLWHDYRVRGPLPEGIAYEPEMSAIEVAQAFWRWSQTGDTAAFNTWRDAWRKRYVNPG